MSNNGRGPIELLAAATPATVSTALTAFQAWGNSLNLDIVTVTGGAGDCTFTLKEGVGSTAQDHVVTDQDSAVSWTINVNTAGSYSFPLPVSTIPNRWYKLSYSCDTAAGTIAIKAQSWENPAGNFAVNMADVDVNLGELADVVYADDGAWTNDVSKHMLTGGIYQTTPQTVTAGKTAPLQVDSNGDLKVTVDSMSGVVSTVNSSATVLDVGIAFTGTAEDVSGYKSVGINVYASHASAADGLSAQFSSDGTNWDITHVFTIPATTGKFFNLPVEAQYFRLVYTNGITLLTSFRLQTMYHSAMTKESTLRIDDDVDAQTAAQLNRSILTAKEPGGDYTNIDCTTSGNLKVSIEEVNGAAKPLQSIGTEGTTVDVDFDASVASAAVVAAGPVELVSTEDCYYVWGATPTATTAAPSNFLPAGYTKVITSPGTKIAAIKRNVAGKLSVTPLT